MSVTLAANLGGISNDTGGSANTLAVAAAAPVGSLVVAIVSCNDASKLTTLTDPRGNTYTKVAAGGSLLSSNYQGIGLYASVLTTALQSGDVLTVNGTSSVRGLTAAAFSNVAGNAATTSYGLTTLYNSSSGSPSVTTSASVDTADLVVGGAVSYYTPNAGNFVNPAGWSNFPATDTAPTWGAGWIDGSGGTATYNPSVPTSKGAGSGSYLVVAFHGLTAPGNTVAPSVTGAARAGQKLSCSAGSWS